MNAHRTDSDVLLERNLSVRKIGCAKYVDFTSGILFGKILGEVFFSGSSWKFVLIVFIYFFHKLSSMSGDIFSVTGKLNGIYEPAKAK